MIKVKYKKLGKEKVWGFGDGLFSLGRCPERGVRWSSQRLVRVGGHGVLGVGGSAV